MQSLSLYNNTIDSNYNACGESTLSESEQYNDISQPISRVQKSELFPCGNCGRTFGKKSLTIHEKNCKK
eukprot:UN30650